MMGRQMNCFSITIYILLNILNNYKCTGIDCYECDYCPTVNNSTPIKSGCNECVTAGANNQVSRTCLNRSSGARANFPSLNWAKCYGNRCNKRNSTLVIENPISCYICRVCSHNKERIDNMCGACAIRDEPGSESKFCLESCDEAPAAKGYSCCTTDLCNGGKKLNTPISCHVCKDCSPTKERVETECGACATRNESGSISKYCLKSCDEAPADKGYSCCTTDLCNAEKKLNTPISCHVCKDCSPTNERVETVCGACATRNESGTISKYCLESCDEAPVAKGYSCCTTDLCNGEKKLNTPISCHVCKDCSPTNERVETVCGACATHTAFGSINKFCLHSCDLIPALKGFSCCTTDLCNGEIKLNIHIGLMIFLLSVTHFSIRAL
ncbi:unnamed protein product [Trichobilharzia szidati]|nr:unnamed protein product [Trichobilharzia szidati]